MIDGSQKRNGGLLALELQNSHVCTVKTRIQEHPFSGFRLIGFLYIGYF